MLAGLLMISKGDRIAMHSSVETRYPFLDDDVIDFCASIAPEYKLHGMTEKWLLRQVAAKTLPPQIANRPKTMFRASLSKTFLGDHRPAWVDQLLSPESLRTDRLFRPRGRRPAAPASRRPCPRITPQRFVFDVALTCVVSTQLWHHIYCGGGLCDLPVWEPPRREAERASEVATSCAVSRKLGLDRRIPLDRAGILNFRMDVTDSLLFLFLLPSIRVVFVSTEALPA